MPTGFSLTDLARRIARAVASADSARTQQSGPSGTQSGTESLFSEPSGRGLTEREVLRRVSLRPVRGVTVWRTPVLAALGSEERYWRAVRLALSEVPQVEQVERHGASVDITWRNPRESVPPRTAADLQLWTGAADHLRIVRPVVATPPPEKQHAPAPAPTATPAVLPATSTATPTAVPSCTTPPTAVPASAPSTATDALPERAHVWGEALAALARACGDRPYPQEGPSGQVTLRSEAPGTATATERTVRVRPGRVLGLDGRTPSEIDLGVTALRAAWLVQAAGESSALEEPEFWARPASPGARPSPAQAGFVLAHARQVALAAAERHVVGGTQSLLVDLAAVPFVQEKALVQADPSLFARLLLRIAAATRESPWGPDDGPVPAASAALVLDHGMRALGLVPPTRV